MSHVARALRKASQESRRDLGGGGGTVDWPADAAITSPWDFDAPSELPAVPSHAPRSTAVAHVRPFRDLAVGGVAVAPDLSAARMLVVSAQARDDFRDQFHKIAAALYDLRERKEVRVVMIASAAPAEGKTLTAVNLALTLSGSYSSRVLLIDADLRRPSVHRVLGLGNTRGLRDCAALRSGDPLPTVQVLDYLTVLPAGIHDNAGESASPLIADVLRAAIAESRTADWIVVDTPPVQFMPDAQIVAGLVDAAVLVVHAGSTPFALAQRAVETIGRERFAGVVLNQVTSALGHYSYYGYDQSR